MLVTILSKILGFSREVVLAYFYGASNISDVYLISCTIPGVIFSLIGTGISTSFIPLYSKIQKNKGTKSSILYMNNTINFLMIISILITIFAMLFTPSIVRVFASGFEGETYDLAVKLTRISIICIFFSAFTYVYTGFLHINGNFVIPALIGIPFNLITIIFIVLSARTNILLLAIGSVLSRIFELLFLIPFVKKHKFKYKLNINFNDEYLKEMIFLSFPVIIGVSVNQVNVLIDKTIASKISVGGISALNYSSRLNSFVQGIFAISLATVMYPLISKMAAENNMPGLKKTIAEAISGINLLVIPITIGSMVFAKPVVKLLFGRGAFDNAAIEMTAYTLLFYSIGMIGFGLMEVLSRAFYSFQDTKTPMINATIGMVLNIILNIILSRFLGIGGLALATSISAILCTLMLLISLRKKIGPFGIKKISITFVKILYASLAMGIIAVHSFNYLTTIISENLSLIAAIGIGAINYFTMIYLMKIDDLDAVVNVVKRKLMRCLSMCKVYLMKINDLDVVANVIKKKFMRCLSMCKILEEKESVCLTEAIIYTRQIQLAELDMLIEMDRICKDNSLRYYLAYGTALGAVRHQGFIPWDTGIDIAVDIDNYKRFCDTVHREIPSKYTLRSIQTDNSHELLKARIVPKDPYYPKTHIDIFPMIGVPENQLGSRLFSQIAYIVYKGFFIKKVNHGINYKKVLLKRIIARLLKILLVLVPSKLFVWIFEKISVAFPIEKSNVLYMFCGHCSEKELVPKSYFDIPQKMMFEGYEFPLPREWDKYLTHIYKDYMVPDRKV